IRARSGRRRSAPRGPRTPRAVRGQSLSTPARNKRAPGTPLSTPARNKRAPGTPLAAGYAVNASAAGLRRLRMKVALRDDDTCYFTKPETLERVYGDVWTRVPVCLATVPFAVGYRGAGIPPRHWDGGGPFALARNSLLVDRLRELVAAGRAT